MDKNRIVNYLENRIEGYKQQDRKAGGEINDENYRNAEWCLKRMRNYCQRKGFELEIRRGKSCSNFTAQRIDNDLSHTVDNCIAWCLYCNCNAHSMLIISMIMYMSSNKQKPLVKCVFNLVAKTHS